MNTALAHRPFARCLLLCLLLVGFASAVCAQADGFRIDTLSAATQARIIGHSYPTEASAHIPLKELRLLTVLHIDAEGQTHQGELIVNRAIADDVIAIFRQLYEWRFPIERMKLIDEYEANDEASMRANNTSAFCFRVVKGSKQLSRHALGMAVDINPLYNPCFRVDANGRCIASSLQPATATAYANRERNTSPYKITQRVVTLFRQHGFRWGGNWRRSKDYHHFER